ncbi:MAG: aldo/keto reductase [Thermodesulfobacteriota bacterium]
MHQMKRWFRLTRRGFIKQALAWAGAAILPKKLWASAEGVPKRSLGNTGEKVSILGLGGWHIGSIQEDQTAIRLIRHAVDQGVTFMDNAWEYHHGRSEELMGRALKDGYRKRVFLMSKHHGRKDKKTALQHLEESLKRLNTDVIDLWQFHEIIYDDDPDMIFSRNGAIEAAYEAQKAGKVRFIGFTGHKDPRLFLEMLAHDFPWNTVQMPVNILDAQFRSFQKEVLPKLQERNIGVIAMKTLGSGHLLKTGLVKPEECLNYAWSQPVATIVSGIDSMSVLEKNIRLARRFSPMSEKAQQQLLEKTRSVALTGKYEPFKTSRQFDGWKGRELHS